MSGTEIIFEVSEDELDGGYSASAPGWGVTFAHPCAPMPVDNPSCSQQTRLSCARQRSLGRSVHHPESLARHPCTPWGYT